MIWVIVIAVVVVFILIANNSAKAKEKARQAYQQSLQALKSDPTNSDLRQKTLALGRVYSNMMRDNKGNTVFDEVALMNDINAACAGASQVVSQTAAAPAPAESIEARLRKLQGLLESGLIDNEDFSRRKREIMDQI